MPMSDDEYFRRYFNIPGTYGYGAQRFLDQTANMPVYVPPALPQYEQKQFVPGVFSPAPSSTQPFIPVDEFADFPISESIDFAQAETTGQDAQPDEGETEQYVPEGPKPENIDEPIPAETFPVTESGDVVTRELSDSRGISNRDNLIGSVSTEGTQNILLKDTTGERLKTPIIEVTLINPEGDVVSRSTDMPYGEIDIKPIPIQDEPINPEVLTSEIEKAMQTEFPQVQDLPLVVQADAFQSPSGAEMATIEPTNLETTNQELAYAGLPETSEQFVGSVEEAALPGFEAPSTGFTEAQPSQAVAFPVTPQGEIVVTNLPSITDQELAYAGLPETSEQEVVDIGYEDQGAGGVNLQAIPGLLAIGADTQPTTSGLLEAPISSLSPEAMRELVIDELGKFGQQLGFQRGDIYPERMVTRLGAGVR